MAELLLRRVAEEATVLGLEQHTHQHNHQEDGGGRGGDARAAEAEALLRRLAADPDASKLLGGQAAAQTQKRVLSPPREEWSTLDRSWGKIDYRSTSPKPKKPPPPPPHRQSTGYDSVVETVAGIQAMKRYYQQVQPPPPPP